MLTKFQLLTDLAKLNHITYSGKNSQNTSNMYKDAIFQYRDFFYK